MSLSRRPLRPVRSHRRVRRGFNLVELLIALAITSALLSATMAALNACFIAYQATTEEASTHTVSRLVMHRVLALVRTGSEFGPLPEDPRDTTTAGDVVEFTSHAGQIVRIEFDPNANALLYSVDGGEPQTLLRGVERTMDGEVEVPAFTMEWEKGTRLFRFTMDLTVVGDDNQTTKLDLGIVRPIRLVASAMPRVETW